MAPSFSSSFGIQLTPHCFHLTFIITELLFPEGSSVEMGASWFSTVMDSIPVVVEAAKKFFPSSKARAAITGDAEAVYKAKQNWEEMTKNREVKLYKQQITNMDKQTLKSVVMVLERDWDDSVKQLPSFKMLVESAKNEWKFQGNVVEQIEWGRKGTEFLYYKIIQDSGEYHLAICHLKVPGDTRVSDNVVIGGLMAQGLLARDKDNNIYLQFE